MADVWCVEHVDGWCAVAGDVDPGEGALSVETRCGHSVTLPLGIERRAPDCEECLAAVAAGNI